MKVCIVGGIFGRSLDYQGKHALTPETILAKGLRARSVEVETVGHFQFAPSDRFDIVHVHHLATGALRMAASTQQVPFVFTPHGWIGHEPSLLHSLAFRYVLRRCDGLVTLSHREICTLNQYLSSKTACRVIPNGIPDDLFYPAQESRRLMQTQPARILYVGQLVSLKGVDVLFRAFQRVVANRDAQLLLVYQNPQLEERYRQLAAQLGISRQVKFIGMLGVEALSAIYRDVDLLVLPSRTECLPSVITEALLSGLPIVATNVGGIPEQVGRYGRLVPPEKSEELCYAILATIQELEQGMTQCAERRSFAKEHFAIERMIDLHLDLYNSLLVAKPSGVRTSRLWSERLVDMLLQLHSGGSSSVRL